MYLKEKVTSLVFNVDGYCKLFYMEGDKILRKIEGYDKIVEAVTKDFAGTNIELSLKANPKTISEENDIRLKRRTLSRLIKGYQN